LLIHELYTKELFAQKNKIRSDVEKTNYFSAYKDNLVKSLCKVGQLTSTHGERHQMTLEVNLYKNLGNRLLRNCQKKKHTLGSHVSMHWSIDVHSKSVKSVTLDCVLAKGKHALRTIILLNFFFLT